MKCSLGRCIYIELIWTGENIFRLFEHVKRKTVDVHKNGEKPYNRG